MSYYLVITGNTVVITQLIGKKNYHCTYGTNITLNINLEAKGYNCILISLIVKPFCLPIENDKSNNFGASVAQW